MHKLRNSFIASIIFVILMGVAAAVYPQSNSASVLTTPVGDVAFEVVGQVTNLSGTPISVQYGYLSNLNGLRPDQIFATGEAASQNQSTALFTFYTRATTYRAISNDGLNTINRTGTTIIYFDETPDGNFANPNSFRDGTPILTLTLRQQVIVDTAERTFTVTNVNAVTSAKTFSLGDDEFRLGNARDQFRTSLIGRLNTAGVSRPSGFFAGQAVAIEVAIGAAKPELQ